MLLRQARESVDPGGEALIREHHALPIAGLGFGSVRKIDRGAANKGQRNRD